MGFTNKTFSKIKKKIDENFSGNSRRSICKNILLVTSS